MAASKRRWTHNKRKRRIDFVDDDNEKDRISELPDSIIQHILSFLCTKEAIKTCVLSKRWESLWTSIPNRLLHCNSHIQKEVNSFASFVDKALMKLESEKITKFSLRCPFHRIPYKNVDSWLHFAVNHHVKELCLQFKVSYLKEAYKWPEFMFANSSVTKMNLISFWLDEGFGGFYLKSLKYMTLTNSTLRIDKVRSILQGSPLLECLTLQGCRLLVYNDLAIIDASGTNLKELVIDEVLSERIIDISAPNLLSLTIIGYIDHPQIKLVDVSSLVEANMDFIMRPDSYGIKQYKLRDFVHGLSHVNKLTVDIRCFQDGSTEKAIRARFLQAICKSLEVDIKWTIGYLSALLVLLYSFPEVEQLTINLMPFDYLEFKPADFSRTIGSFWHLKSVEITGFVVGSCSNSSNFLFELVQYLLVDTIRLEKLIIHAGTDSVTSATPESFKKLYEITQMLLSYPRYSRDAAVIFKSHLQ